MDSNTANQSQHLTGIDRTTENIKASSSSVQQQIALENQERDACGVGFIADRQGRASHELVDKALSALTCMEHRGGCSADRDSGDGTGVMTAMPWELLQSWATAQGLADLDPERTAVGMVFLPRDAAAATTARQMTEQILNEEGLVTLGWRIVPVQPTVLGIQARENQPQIEQILVHSDQLQGDDLERLLCLWILQQNRRMLCCKFLDILIICFRLRSI